MLAMWGIEEWLEGLGLGEYAARFVENDIDFAILGDLSDQDLEKIGVVSLGHRRKLLRAIAARLTAGQHCDVLQHGLAAIAEARSRPRLR
jgi:hypothetical protein